jgi:hypothetical protein
VCAVFGGAWCSAPISVFSDRSITGSWSRYLRGRTDTVRSIVTNFDAEGSELKEELESGEVKEDELCVRSMPALHPRLLG